MPLRYQKPRCMCFYMFWQGVRFLPSTVSMWRLPMWSFPKEHLYEGSDSYKQMAMSQLLSGPDPYSKKRLQNSYEIIICLNIMLKLRMNLHGFWALYLKPLWFSNKSWRRRACVETLHRNKWEITKSLPNIQRNVILNI